MKALFRRGVVLCGVLMCAAALAAPGIGGALDDLTQLKEGRGMRASTSAEAWETSNADAPPIEPGETLVLADLKGPGVIGHIWNTVASYEEGHSRLLMLRMYWDGETTPSVECPLGDFFAMGHGINLPVDSLPVRVTAEGKARNCYWSMPFAKSAKITVTNEGKMRVGAFYSYVDWRTLPKLPKNTAYFHAMYRQEFPTAIGKRYLLADIEGRGHYVGTVLSVYHRSGSWFGEGDDFFFVDGEEKPGLRGTGTEDYFCDAWGFRQQSGPYYGAPLYEGGKTGARASVYRWHITDPIVFQKSLRAEIEHVGPIVDQNDKVLQGYGERIDDFSSVAYWYQSEPHKPWPAPPAGYDRLAHGGPVVSGILRSSNSVEWKAEQLRMFLKKTEFSYLHCNVAGTQVDKLTLPVPVSNEVDVPLQYQVELRTQGAKPVVLGSVKGEIAPKSKQTVEIPVVASPAVSVQETSLTTLVWNLVYTDPAGVAVPFSIEQPCGFDTPFTLAKANKPVAIDGNLEEWAALPFSVQSPADLIGGPLWRDAKDASYRFALARDEQFLYVAMEAIDDQVIAAPGIAPWLQDGVEIRIDARPKGERPNDGDERTSNGLFIALSPADNPDNSYAVAPAQWPAGTKAVCKKTTKGYSAEVAVPMSYLDQVQKNAWSDIRFNICLDDADAAEEETSQLWWRPDWRTGLHYAESGLFTRE